MWSCVTIMAMPDEPFYAPDRRPAERTATPGFKLWELRNGDRVLTCELRDDDRLGAGVDVQLLEGRELMVSQRCVTADGARFVAESYRQDHLRTGWTDITPENASTA